PTGQDRRRAHRAWFKRRVDRSAALQKICIFRAVVVEHLRSVVVFDACFRRTGAFCPYPRDSHSQCSLLSVLNRALMSMNLIVFERQHLTIDVVYDESVDIQSLKMRWLSCAAAVCRADGRIEPKVK